jgi:two-component system, cell cycle response regulator
VSSPQTTSEQIVQSACPPRDVLVAEDDPMFRKILLNWLQSWDYKVIVATDGTEAWSILQKERPPDLLILDWVMPGIDGMELCRRIRERQSPSYQYILVVTANDARQDVVRGLEAGADDYLTKPFDKGELRARLRVGTRILTLQEDLIRAREDLRFQATHDVLTGIWNRRAILDLLHRELERAARFRASTGVLMLDLDEFKKINDTYGHLKGDAVLKETAQRITQVVRSYDFVGRYGGEEFLVLLPGCDKEQAEQSGERIRLAVTATPVFAAGSEISVTISIGATANIGGPETEVLAIADAALYQAKSAGRNRTVAS